MPFSVRATLLDPFAADDARRRSPAARLVPTPRRVGVGPQHARAASASDGRPPTKTPAAVSVASASCFPPPVVAHGRLCVGSSRLPPHAPELWTWARWTSATWAAWTAWPSRRPCFGVRRPGCGVSIPARAATFFFFVHSVVMAVLGCAVVWASAGCSRGGWRGGLALAVRAVAS